MATFHAPPWWPPPWMTFLRLIMIGAFTVVIFHHLVSLPKVDLGVRG